MVFNIFQRWWNCVIAEDFDQDGDQDLIAGNAGLNNQFKVSRITSHIGV